MSEGAVLSTLLDRSRITFVINIATCRIAGGRPFHKSYEISVENVKH